jgi:branched-chain amino acid transport system permease protein
MTLAFAFLADQLFFQSSRVSGGEGGIPVPRPAGFQSEKGLFYLALGFLILFSIIALNLRTGRTGRVLAAMRDSETASRALGIPVTRYKVLIFGLSAFIAGFGGVLFAMILETATSRTFIPFYSLFYLAIAVLGGIFDVGGAIAGGLLFGLYTKLSTYQALSFLNQIQFIVFGLGATVVLAGNPEGLIWELRRAGAKIRDLFGQERHPARPSPVPVAGGQE